MQTPSDRHHLRVIIIIQDKSGPVASCFVGLCSLKMCPEKPAKPCILVQTMTAEALLHVSAVIQTDMALCEIVSYLNLRFTSTLLVLATLLVWLGVQGRRGRRCRRPGREGPEAIGTGFQDVEESAC